MSSLFCTIDSTLKTFFGQLTETLGFGGYLGIILGAEALFIILFVIKSAFSYEARLKKSLDNANKWLFKNKIIDENNIRDFNNVIKKGPKRLVYYWQQYILYREGGPSNYMTEENIIEKPLKTSSWQSNIKTLSMLTIVWSIVALLFGFASQSSQAVIFQAIAVSLFFMVLVLILGAVAIIFLKGKRVLNLDDIYHLYHIFSRFVNNACADLVPYLDFDLLFTAKEIEKGNPQLREYYEARARKAKEEFENASKNDVQVVDYHFENIGVDGALLLKRAMKESELYINKKTSIMSQIAQIEAQKDALRRNYENTQMDLQRKIQASKENIQKLIEQQAATTSRIEVGLLRQQQEKEANKKTSLQKDYDNEEARYNSAKAELENDIVELNKVLDKSFDEVQKGMVSEYQSFFEKVMKNAYSLAENKVKEEKKEIISQRDKNEDELINVQTQIKRLMDENATLRQRLGESQPDYKEEIGQSPQGHYNEEGNFVYEDGSYHDANGLFHDSQGNVYDMNGQLVTSKDAQKDEDKAKLEKLENAQIEQFGSFIPTQGLPDVTKETTQEQVENAPAKKRGRPRKETTIQEETDNAPKKRGRPRKTEAANKEVKSQEAAAPAKKRGRPKKTESVSESATTAPAKKRGRPRKEESAQAAEKAASETPKKRGRPKKSDKQEDSLSEINNMINAEEEKLASAQNDISSKIDEALNESKDNSQDREGLLKEVEELTAQADEARLSGKSDEELAKINNKIEELIGLLSKLNSDDNQ